MDGFLETLARVFVLPTASIASPGPGLTDKSRLFFPNLGPNPGSSPDKVPCTWRKLLAQCLLHLIQEPLIQCQLNYSNVLVG